MWIERSDRYHQVTEFGFRLFCEGWSWGKERREDSESLGWTRFGLRFCMFGFGQG